MNLLQIQKNSDGSVDTIAWGVNADGSLERAHYGSAEALQKVLPLISKSINGLAKDSDATNIFFNENGDTIKIEHLDHSTKKDEAPVGKVFEGSALTASLPLVSSLKTDVISKIPPVDVKISASIETPDIQIKG